MSCWLRGILEEIHSLHWPGTGQSRLLFFLPAIIPTGRWLGFCCVAMAMASPPGDVFRGAEHSSQPACPRAPTWVSTWVPTQIPMQVPTWVSPQVPLHASGLCVAARGCGTIPSPSEEQTKLQTSPHRPAFPLTRSFTSARAPPK